MHQYILSTPESHPSFQKCLGNTSSSIPDDDCPYCLMKRKFNIGSTGDQRCFEHSIKANLDLDKVSDDRSESKSAFIGAEDMVDMLAEVEDSLDYYWDNLREVSGGNPDHIHRELEPVLASVKRVQEKIGKFFFDNPNDVSEIRPVSTFTAGHKKFYNSGS